MRAPLSLLAIVLALLAAIAGSADAAPLASKVRLGEHPDKTRFVLEVSENVPYRVFTLVDPYRVVIDLPEVSWRISPKAMSRPVGLVEQMRFGLFAPGHSRVVLDTKAPVQLDRVLVLEPSGRYPYRLVLDLAPISRAALLAEPKVLESDPPLSEPKSPQLPLRGADERLTVVVDAGHGGVDPGAIGVSGIYEKDIVLAYAKELKRRLEATGNHRVILTRDRDIYVKLDDRRRIAQEAGADLFISLHADAHPTNGLRGASVYTLSEEASDELAAALAEQANRSDMIAGIDLAAHSPLVSEILIDLAKRETMNLSARYASMLTDHLAEEVALLPKPRRSAGFAVLKSADVPSVLLELGFLTNPREERLLRSKAFRHKIVNAIARSVRQHFQDQQAMR